ncbi:Enhancer of mRNA-decapping protein [Spathaspora sp. JA1]|nr:Enhancer of mRNA-decapping protein [Spathaspora sp. JA1]
MTEFLNYRVDLTLKDGSKSNGIISHVDAQQIILDNVSQSINPGSIISNYTVKNTDILDLKVVQLPANLKKKNKTTTQYVSSSAGSVSSTPRGKSPDWETDAEVQDIQGADFDFEANLAMFDKKSVFADFQKMDNVLPHDRLVGHNKLENVSKQKKKEKYDNNEMVLERNRSDNWDLIGSHSTTNTNTPIISKDITGAHTPQLKFTNANNGTVLPLASPVQLLEIERLSIENGITANIMAEISGTNLSQVIINNILGGDSRFNKLNHNLPPLVLLLIGSSRCGSRALATGRHLSNHGVRVLAFMINSPEQPQDQQDQDEDRDHLNLQLKLFELNGGKLIVNNFKELLDIITNQLDTPVELIIDSLQGYDDHLEDIYYKQQDQIVLRQVINWVNEPIQHSKLMSMEIPSGIDGGSGIPSDDSLVVKSRWCISMGFPVSGLILAYKNNQFDLEDMGHYLLDIGIPNKVYSNKTNLRKFDKFWYENAQSVIKMEVSK